MRCLSYFLILVMQVFLAKPRHDGKYYAIKVLQKKIILNRKEVTLLFNTAPTRFIFKTCIWQIITLLLNHSFRSAKTHHGRAQCAAEECETPFPGWASLFLPDHRQVIFRLGFCQWRRSELFCPCESFFWHHEITHHGFGKFLWVFSSSVNSTFNAAMYDCVRTTNDCQHSVVNMLTPLLNTFTQFYWIIWIRSII